MTDWSAAGCDACLETNDDVIWLSPRGDGTPIRKALHTALDTLEDAGALVVRTSAFAIGGFALSAALPGTALAPVGTAQASIEQFLAKPALPIAFTIPPSPVFARSSEERGVAKADETRREVEEFLRFGSRELPRRMVESIVQAATRTGVDAIYLMALADKESSFRASIKASTSSAEGLFQFIDRTWLETVQRFGSQHGLGPESAAVTTVDDRPVVANEAERTRILDLRRDPYLSAVMAAELLKADAAQLGFRFGRRLNETEMYLAHFLGVEEAARFIALGMEKKPPNAAAAFPAAARANRGIFFERRRRGHRGLSVPEVYAKLRVMIDDRVERYKGVQSYASADPRS